MRYYVSGPMTSIAENNFPAFEDATKKMRALGLDVLPAHEIKHPAEVERWSDYLRKDLIEMLTSCNAIVLLSGWQRSKGSRLELHVARALSMPVFFWADDKLESPTKHALEQLLDYVDAHT